MHAINTDERTILSKAAVAETLLGQAESGANGHLVEREEADDGVEALIVSMDATTLEHIFLQAQRQMQREAANTPNEARR